MKACQWCLEVFESKVDYQIYCGKECREAATKEKVKERVRLSAIKRRYKKKRYCANGCGTKLNAHNESKICRRCVVDEKLVNKAVNNLKDFFDFEEEG